MSSAARLGQEFGEHVQKVTGELLLGGAPDSLSEMERRVRKALLQIGQFLLGAWLALQEGPYLAQTVECRCGGSAAYQFKREGVLLTLLGDIHYKRAYYVCPTCHAGTYPLDERLGLRPGELSAELESLVGLTGAQTPFEKGSELFERLTLVGISPQSMDKATQTMGQEAMQVEAEWVAQSQDPTALDRQMRAACGTERLYGTLDATKVHTDEKRSADDNGWRDLKVGAWFLTEAKPPQDPDDAWDIKARDITYFCDICEAEKLGILLWATGFQRQALRAQEIIFVGDGAEWIWNLVQEHFPHAVQIVDWFHAAEYLTPIAQTAFTNQDEAKAWRTHARELLWTSQVDEVIAQCASFVEQKRGTEAAQKALTYFRNNRQRMDYAAYRAKGYHIGSGTIESGCKQIGTQRMKVPGATWSLEGARRTAKARAAMLSGQWDHLASRREHLPRAA
jgi:hypothetical protein